MSETLTGTCRLCEETFGRGISSHIKSCITDYANQASLHHGLLVGVRASGLAGRFWMYLLVRPEASLSELDAFFRETWLDCCDHPSLFDIKETEYLSTIDPADEDDAPMASMEHEVGGVLHPRMEFRYEYDPEAPSELECRVFDPYPCPAKLLEDNEDALVVVLARNGTPERDCSICGEPATSICIACVEREEASDDDAAEDEEAETEASEDSADDGDREQEDTTENEPAGPPGPWACDDCQSEHDGPIKPIVNSPRMGVCDYGM